MMNPEMHFRDAERIERETFGREYSAKPSRHPTQTIPLSAINGSYSREQLASGCILYRLT
jgi:hypothetical protein